MMNKLATRASTANLSKPKDLKLDKKTFQRLFKVVDEDYFETASILLWFNRGTGLDKRFSNYKKSSGTQSEIDRWNVFLSGQITAQKVAVILMETGQIAEGVHGRSSGKVHRVLMPYFLQWLSKGTPYALVAWWQLYHAASHPKPQPVQLSLELKAESKAVRRSLTDLYKEWWENHPGESKAPNFGTYCWQRENQLMQALFGRSITALKQERGLDAKQSLRDFLPAEWVALLQATEEAIAALLEVQIPPKLAIEGAVKTLKKQAPMLVGSQIESQN